MTTINIPTITISKTTLNGYLTLGITVCLALTQVQGVPVKVSACAAVVLGILRCIVGILQKDADSTPAIVPDGTVKNVPAHPVPDNPADIAVAETAPVAPNFIPVVPKK